MKHLTVGIGCRRGASVEQIDAAVRATLGDHFVDDIVAIATIDSKAHEPGIVAFCERHALPLRIFSRAQIASLPDALPTPSVTVHTHVGVDGVCEPCALLAAPQGRLIVPKRVFDGVAVAIAVTVADATFAQDPSEPNEQDHR